MIEDLNRAFQKISDNLYTDSWNYCANFKLFRCPTKAGRSLDEVARAALSEVASVGDPSESTEAEVLETLLSSLRYKGEPDHHPSLKYLESAQSQQDFDGVIAAVKKILDASHSIVSFRLDDGHPFYPVFWDFAFWIETADDSILFIASSSD